MKVIFIILWFLPTASAFATSDPAKCFSDSFDAPEGSLVRYIEQYGANALSDNDVKLVRCLKASGQTLLLATFLRKVHALVIAAPALSLEEKLEILLSVASFRTTDRYHAEMYVQASFRLMTHQPTQFRGQVLRGLTILSDHYNRAGLEEKSNTLASAIYTLRVSVTDEERADAIGILAAGFEKQVDHPLAEEIYDLALSLREKLHGSADIRTAAARLALGKFWLRKVQARGRFTGDDISKIENILQMAAQTFARADNKDGKLECYLYLAAYYRLNGDLEGAKNAASVVFSALNEGQSRRVTDLEVSALKELAYLHEWSGDLIASETLYAHLANRRVAELKQRADDHYHAGDVAFWAADVAESIDELSSFYRRHSKVHEAEAACDRALAVLQLAAAVPPEIRFQNQTAPPRVPLLHSCILREMARSDELAFEIAQLFNETQVGNAVKQLALRLGQSNVQAAAQIREIQDLQIRKREVDIKFVAALSSQKRNDIEIISKEIELLRSQYGRKVTSLERDILTKKFSDINIISIEDVKNALSSEEVLIFFHENLDGLASMAMWVIAREKVLRLPFDEVTNQYIHNSVQALRCGLSRGEWDGIKSARRCGELLKVDRVPGHNESLPFNLKISHNLYKILFNSVEELIKGKTLIVVPSGSLASLPLQVLITGKLSEEAPEDYEDYRNANWLGAQHPIVVLPSVSSILLRANTLPSAPRAYIGFGNPILTGNHNCVSAEVQPLCQVSAPTSTVSQRGRRDARNTNLEHIFKPGANRISLLRELCPLPDTASELRCVAENLGVDLSNVRLGAAATEAEVKSRTDLDQYRIVHFATHGIIAGDLEALTKWNAEPGLILTPPDVVLGSDNDGLLLASEIVELKLNADWVILSACNTAAGESAKAEALSGLARAFFYAGAKTLLVSHWPVYSDAAVSLITTAFVERRVNPDISNAEAMRRAMVKLMASNIHQSNAHPEVWAPFAVVGDAGTAAVQEGARGR